MMKLNSEFKIFAHGHNFDVDSFLKDSSIKFDSIWKRGEHKRFACVSAPHETSGIEVVLGDGFQLPVHTQDEIARDFINKHMVLLSKLAVFPGVEYYRIGLQYHIEYKSNLLGFCMGPSPELMELLLKIGKIELNFYVTLNRTNTNV